MEYIADKNLISANGKTKKRELYNRAGKIIISPNKLILGGLAILRTENRNHHKAIAGLTNRKPFTKSKLRLCDFSYVKLAKANNAEEQNPCEIIKIKAPLNPHVVLLIAPASIKDMCPTEE